MRITFETGRRQHDREIAALRERCLWWREQSVKWAAREGIGTNLAHELASERAALDNLEAKHG